jgi:hypothetical protein
MEIPIALRIPYAPFVSEDFVSSDCKNKTTYPAIKRFRWTERCPDQSSHRDLINKVSKKIILFW